MRLVERVVAPLGLRLDRASPLVDARLADGSRLHAVIPPLAVDGPCVTIRRFAARPVPLEAFAPGDAAAAFLRWSVVAGWNLVVSGGTSAGKTTLLNALSGAIPAGERIVTIEETAELRLAQPHVVRLEARTPNAEGAGGVSVRELVRASLRMRPDRIVVGEVRGAEALDMLQALNTGHEGSLSTVHANGAGDALARLETLALLAATGLPLAAVRSQIAAAVDGVVHVARRQGGERRIETVGELVAASEGLAVRELFGWRSGRARADRVRTAPAAPVARRRPRPTPGGSRADPAGRCRRDALLGDAGSLGAARPGARSGAAASASGRVGRFPTGPGGGCSAPWRMPGSRSSRRRRASSRSRSPARSASSAFAVSPALALPAALAVLASGPIGLRLRARPRDTAGTRRRSPVRSSRWRPSYAAAGRSPPA